MENLRFKFNAWDSLEKQYIRFDEWLEEEDIEIDGEYVTHNEALAKFLDYHCGCDLLQYTGLKDKNGKEIFNGDLIKVNNVFVMQVVFNPLRTELKYVSGPRGEWIEVYLYCHLPKNIEVTGNIYEHNHLLEKTKC